MIFAGVYFSAVLVLSAWLILYRSPENKTPESVTVLIAARNESAHIGECLEALARQEYSPELFEVIVIDDRSADNTGDIARSYHTKIRNVTVIRIHEVPPGIAPKKHALSVGIEHSRGGILLCTDADCRPQPGWIGKMISCFDDQTGMVIGYSPIVPKNPYSLQHRFSALDGLSLAAIACATAKAGYPATATGRSLAYRKKPFTEVGGFSKIAPFISGDDDLLMHLFKKTPWKIAYCPYPDAQVVTDPPATWKYFFHQKIRHASKSKHYSPKMILPLVLVWLFNAGIALSTPLLLVAEPGEWQWTILPFLVKFTADGFFLLISALRFRRLTFMLFYPVIAILHPYYITVFGLLGLFVKFEWKDRRFATTLESK